MDLRWWAKRSAAVGLTLLGLAVAAWVVARAQLAVGLAVAALLLAVALNRPVHALEERRVPRGLAIAAVMLTVLAALAGVVLLLVPPAVRQVQQLVENGPRLLDRLRASDLYRFLQAHLDLDQLLARGKSQAPGLARTLIDPALAALAAVLGGVAELVTVLFLTLFMLTSGRPLVWSALALAQPERRARYASVLLQIYRSLGGYIAGLLLLVLTNAALAGTYLAIIGVPYFLPLAVLSGLSSLVPYAGAIVAGVLLSLVAWASGGPGLGFLTAGYYVLYQQFENHVVAPLVYRRTVALNPLVILLAALVLTDLLGIPGALVAVPLAAAAQIVLRELLRERRERLGLPDVRPGPELLQPGRPPSPAGASPEQARGR